MLFGCKRNREAGNETESQYFGRDNAERNKLRQRQNAGGRDKRPGYGVAS